MINIGLLVVLIVCALARANDWVRAVQSTFTQGAVAYVAWTVFLVIATPWLFP